MTKASLASGLRTLTLSAVVAFAGSAGAANLTDVRVGVHRDHTRVVLETDARAPYVVNSGELEVVIHVDAAASAEAVTAMSPHLIWAKVEPTEIGADVRLLLKQPADVRAMVLTGPHRIVLDLYPKQVAVEPLPAPELLTEDEPAATAATEPVPGPTPEEMELAELEPIVEELDVAELDVAELAEQELEEELAPDVEPAAEEDTLASTEPSPAAPAEALEARAPRVAPERAQRQEPESAPSTPFGSPLLLAAAAIAFLAVLVFLRRRSRSADKVTFPERFDEVPAPFDAPQRALPVDAPSAAGESLFDVEADALLRPLPKDDELLPHPRQASPVSGDETERRFAHLERRIEELVDARERLERQVAAQTEELRVQRAAIARTQRVLRTVAPRTDEEPSNDPVKG